MSALTSRSLVSLSIGVTHLGKAVFTLANLRAGETIMAFAGPRIPESSLLSLTSAELHHYMQIGPKLYLGPSGGLDDLVNHSCNPNSGVRFQKGQIALVAIRDIRIGEEVTWDYATTSFASSWSMQCRCCSPRCRSLIGDFTELPEAIQHRYRALGVLPPYLVRYLDDIHPEGFVSS